VPSFVPFKICTAVLTNLGTDDPLRDAMIYINPKEVQIKIICQQLIIKCQQQIHILDRLTNNRQYSLIALSTQSNPEKAMWCHTGGLST